MNVDVCLVEEDLIQREIPKRVEEGARHPLIILPVRRNALPDGYRFVVRCTSGEKRKQVGNPPRAPVYAFEATIQWLSARINAENIAMFHNLFPVHESALSYLVGRGFLDEGLISGIQRSFAGMLWDEKVGWALLPRTSRGKLVPRVVRDASPGDIVDIDGSPGVVVSNVAFNRRHGLGCLAIVPLMASTVESRSGRIEVGSLVAAPEFLKICQPFDGIHLIQRRTERLDTDSLGRLTAQVRELLEWESELPGLLSGKPTSELPVKENEHACLFSTRTRPRSGSPPKHIPVRLSRPIAGATEVFEPTLIDVVRYEGAEGSLRVELWDHSGVISIRLVAEEGRLPVINLVSVLSRDGAIAIAQGPVWPDDWIYSLTLGSLSEVQDLAIDVSVRAPSISAEYTFQLARVNDPEQELSR